MTNAITPPVQWKLRSDGSVFVLDGDWGFPLKRISEAPYEMYAYEVKNFPELVKVGIAKNSKKRLEEYYGTLLWQKKFQQTHCRYG